jgi:hypothetical protein
MNTDRIIINDTLVKLGVIGELKETDLLTWDSSGNPNIQIHGPLRFIRRKWTSQDRNKCLHNLNKTIYNAISLFKELDDEHITMRFKKVLNDSTFGLKNLKLTYYDDKHIQQEIQVLIDEIDNFEKEYQIYEETLS